MIRHSHHNLELEIAFWLNGIEKDTPAAHSKQLTITNRNLVPVATVTAQELLEWVEVVPKQEANPKIKKLNTVPSIFTRQPNF